MDEEMKFRITFDTRKCVIRSWFEERAGEMHGMGSLTVYNDDGSVAEYSENVNGRLTDE